MPTVNIYYDDKSKVDSLVNFASKLKDYLAKLLSTNEIILTSKEISVRFIVVKGSSMISPVEIEITAHAYKKRVERQDEICIEMMNHIKNELPEVGNVSVWLKLCNLGHSL